MRKPRKMAWIIVADAILDCRAHKPEVIRAI